MKNFKLYTHQSCKNSCVYCKKNLSPFKIKDVDVNLFYKFITDNIHKDERCKLSVIASDGSVDSLKVFFKLKELLKYNHFEYIYINTIEDIDVSLLEEHFKKDKFFISLDGTDNTMKLNRTSSVEYISKIVSLFKKEINLYTSSVIYPNRNTYDDILYLFELNGNTLDRSSFLITTGINDLWPEHSIEDCLNKMYEALRYLKKTYYKNDKHRSSLFSLMSIERRMKCFGYDKYINHPDGLLSTCLGYDLIDDKLCGRLKNDIYKNIYDNIKDCGSCQYIDYCVLCPGQFKDKLFEKGNYCLIAKGLFELNKKLISEFS